MLLSDSCYAAPLAGTNWLGAVLSLYRFATDASETQRNSKLIDVCPKSPFPADSSSVQPLEVKTLLPTLNGSLF